MTDEFCEWCGEVILPRAPKVEWTQLGLFHPGCWAAAQRDQRAQGAK